MTSRTRLPLSLKLWAVLAALILLTFGLLAALLPWLLKDFFTDELYRLLSDTQRNVAKAYLTSPSAPGANPAAPRANPAAGAPSAMPGSGKAEQEITVQAIGVETSVTRGSLEPPGVTYQLVPAERVIADGAESPALRHFIADSPAGMISTGDARTDPFVSAIRKHAAEQAGEVARYSMQVGDATLFYVIRKPSADGKPFYIVSYAWGSYRNGLVDGMYGRMLWLMAALIVLGWLPCWLIARYLTKPLVEMERQVGRLAEREWDEPLALPSARRDEIGRLARAIEAMRARLRRQDRNQQFFLQNISHELKTPVMVIRSYAESIKDGIMPKGSLEGSLAVILKESERLEGRVRDLLYLNKMKFAGGRASPAEIFEIGELAEDTIERLRQRRSDIGWALDIEKDVLLAGDREQWRVLFENLLDNQLRYARTRIAVHIGKSVRQRPAIRIANDGPPLGDGEAAKLFEPFHTGAEGQFGLGLAIVRQIAENHGMEVCAANESGEVAFHIVPLPGASPE